MEVNNTETPDLEIEEIEEPQLEGEESTEDDGEDVITIGEDTPPQEQEEKQEAPEWVKELRKAHRETQKENKELRKRLEAKQGGDQPTNKKLKKPTLEECDYDSDLYDQKLEEFYKAKRKEDEQVESAQKAWEQKLNSYSEKKKSLKVRDFDDAEYIVQDTLNETQQGIILQGAENPAIVVYALGKNEKKAKELAQIEDPIKFAFEVAKLETQMKVTRRRPSTEPEKTITGGSGKIAGGADKQLDKLREQARKTGDFSKVVAYKNKLKQGK